jgi:sec-independent protein translocase protein TatB
MFDGIGYSEILVIAVVALIVIGPKDLPRVMRTVGQWAGRARGMARHFRSGVDTMMREAELEEMEKKWRDENERIMRDHPTWEAASAFPPADAAAPGDALPPPVTPEEVGEADHPPVADLPTPDPAGPRPGEPLP